MTTYLAPTSLGRQHPHRLKKALARSGVSSHGPLHASWQGSELLLLWILSVGHSVAKMTKSETRDYFANAVIGIAETHRIHTIGELRVTVERFLYNERAQGLSLWELADCFCTCKTTVAPPG